MDPAIATALTDPDILDLIDSLPAGDGNNALEIATNLRKRGLAPDLIAAIQTQLALRGPLAAKLGSRAHGFLATRDGAEQATRLPVAALRASAFAAAGATAVADLTCGLGVDSIALAARGLAVTAFELDEATAILARHNTRADEHIRVVHGDGRAADLTGIDAIFADPARRTAGGARINDPQRYGPPLGDIWALRHHDDIKIVGVKVGPGIAHRDVPADARAQWLSVDGDVVEATLWWTPDADRAVDPGADPAATRAESHVAPYGAPHGTGPIAPHIAVIARTPAVASNIAGLNTADPNMTGRSNPNLDLTGQAAALSTHVIEGIPDDDPRAPHLDVATESDLAPFLAEPDGAIIRAHLLGTFARATAENSSTKNPARLLSPRIAYLTADQPLPHARNYRITDVLPFHIKKLNGYLRDRGVGSVTIKKRGVDATPEQVRKQLRLSGDNEATLILTRIAGQHRVIVAEPVEGGTP